MPLYEYECEDCGVRFERRQSIIADPLKTCPECGGSVHRLIYPVGIIFKGKGFYVTDNRKAKSSTAVPKTKDDSKAPEKSESSSKSAQTETVHENSSKSE
jgi:putative FmdB family regulatory protein